MTGRATIDVERRLLRLSRAHLAVLAAVARDGGLVPGHEDAVRDLTPDAIDEGGRLKPALAAVASAAANSPIRVLLTFLGAGSEHRIELRWGPWGLLVVPVGDDGTAYDVAFRQSSAFARTLWRVLGLTARTDDLDVVVEEPAERFLAPFRSPHLSGWLADAGVDAVTARLLRIDVEAVAVPHAVCLALVDTPRGLWQVSGGPHMYAALPIRPLEVFETLAGWQAALDSAIRERSS